MFLRGQYSIGGAVTSYPQYSERCVLNKDQLQAFKQTDVTHIYRLLDEALAPRDLLFILEHLGHLPADEEQPPRFRSLEQFLQQEP